MRLLHTSDWHLGHHLHHVSRDAEHAAFLAWLLDILEARAIDALLIAGDVFDTANPSASAQAAYYRFLAEATRRRPGLQIVVVAGNHDSADRLDAPQPLLAALGVTVVGALPRDPAGAFEPERLLVPLCDAGGTRRAWVAAVPYLRPSDLPDVPAPPPGDAPSGSASEPIEAEGALIAGVRAVYAAALDAALARRAPGEALVALGHCYMVGTALSDLSERKILGGNQHALPATIFPDAWAYVALGHLHRAQAVGGRAHVRYAGSPIPLSLDERHYHHQVVIAELEGEGPARIETLTVPRTLKLKRVPEDGGRSLEELLAEIAEWPEATGPWEWRPLLELGVRLDAPEPHLRTRLEAALEGKDARLVKISAHWTGSGQSLAESRPHARLSDLQPEAVFRECHARAHAEPPDAALLAAFHELLDQVQREETVVPAPLAAMEGAS